MYKSILVGIHGGSDINRKFICGDYGSYGRYLSKLRSALCSRNSLLVPRGITTLKLPKRVEIVPSRYLIPKLKEKDVDRIDVCGEFYWHYETENPIKALRRFSETLEPRKRIMFNNILTRSTEVDMERFAKKVGFSLEGYAMVMANSAVKTEVKTGCVIGFYEELRDEFPDVNLIRELCYPETEPPSRFDGLI